MTKIERAMNGAPFIWGRRVSDGRTEPLFQNAVVISDARSAAIVRDRCARAAEIAAATHRAAEHATARAARRARLDPAALARLERLEVESALIRVGRDMPGNPWHGADATAELRAIDTQIATLET